MKKFKNIIIILMVSYMTVEADILNSIKGATSSAIVYTKELSEITPIKAEILSIDLDLQRAYTAIGKKYVEYAKNNPHPNIGANEVLDLMGPLLVKRQELTQKIELIEQKYRYNSRLHNAIDNLDE